MKDRIKTGAFVLSIILTALCISACGLDTGREDKQKVKEVTVFAAASLTDAAEDIKEIYEAGNPDVQLVFSFGASGALRSQIEEGAPADVFISAAQDHMDALEDEGRIVNGSRYDLLKNKVVLVVPADSNKEISSFEDIEKAEMIGIGEPESVPAGKYALQVLKSLGLYEDVKEKFNYGSDVRAVLTWVEEGEVDCGIVYATDAYTSEKVKIVDEAPEGSAERILYPVCLIKGGKNEYTAMAFTDFLKGREAMAVFEKYGFSKAE